MTQGKITKAVIPVAGLGTRFLPASKAVPKEMLNIVDKPCIQYIVEEAVESGIKDIILITGNLKRATEDHFDNSYQLKKILEEKGQLEELEALEKIEKMANFIFIRQAEPLGDGHAILCAKEIVKDETFLVLFGDDIYDASPPTALQLINEYEKYNAPIIGLHKIDIKDSKKYGIVSGKEDNDTILIETLQEKPSPKEAKSSLSIVGKYIITPSLFKTLINTERKGNNELRLADAMKKHIETEKIYGLLLKGKRFDTGDKLGYLDATINFALKHPKLKDSFKKLLSEKYSNIF